MTNRENEKNGAEALKNIDEMAAVRFYRAAGGHQHNPGIGLNPAPDYASAVSSDMV